MLGFQIESPMLTVAGSRTGLLQAEPMRSTRQRLFTTGLALRSAPGAGGVTGRRELKIRYDPSGAIPIEESAHSPEKGAITGFDHSPSILWDCRIAAQLPLVRVKKMVLPSGENTGDPSLAGPEITPGAKSCGTAS